MVMNRKGQQVVVWIMMAIVIFIAAVVISQPLNDQIITVRNASNLNCTDNPAITVSERATCSIVNIGLFYFIATCIAVSIALVAGKRTVTGVMTAIFVFMVVIILITPLKNLIILIRDADHLNCVNTSIAVGARMTCIVADLWLFYFIATCIAAAITIIFVKKVLPR